MFAATNACPGVLRSTCDLIQTELGIDWTRVNYTDLRKPLYSALAAVLYLETRLGNPPAIPATIEQQADTWSHYYHFGTPVRNYTVMAGQATDFRRFLRTSGFSVCLSAVSFCLAVCLFVFLCCACLSLPDCLSVCSCVCFPLFLIVSQSSHLPSTLVRNGTVSESAEVHTRLLSTSMSVSHYHSADCQTVCLPSSTITVSALNCPIVHGVWHVLCTRLRPGHLNVRVGDSSRRSREIVQNLDLRPSPRSLFIVIICASDFLSLQLYSICLADFKITMKWSRYHKRSTVSQGIQSRGLELFERRFAKIGMI